MVLKGTHASLGIPRGVTGYMPLSGIGHSCHGTRAGTRAGRVETRLDTEAANPAGSAAMSGRAERERACATYGCKM